MTRQPAINILLSTYNGEKYIVEQLDSIFHQTYQNFILYIRDDASTDNTVSIISSYFQKHPDFAEKTVVLSDSAHQNLGYMKSFWTLLCKCAKANYYAFCDQDDVWLPDKLSQSLLYLEKESSRLPLLYFSDFDYCDENLNLLHRAPAAHLPITFRDVLFYTPAFGFSIVINDTLRNLALQTTDFTNLPHDGWVQKLAAAFGKILYNPKSTAYYRRHEKAVTASNAKYLTAVLYWLKKEILGSAMKETHFVLTRFQQEYGDKLSPENAQLLSLYSGNSFSPFIWFQRFSYKKRLRPSLGGDLALRLCLFLNRY